MSTHIRSQAYTRDDMFANKFELTQYKTSVAHRCDRHTNNAVTPRPTRHDDSRNQAAKKYIWHR